MGFKHVDNNIKFKHIDLAVKVIDRVIKYASRTTTSLEIIFYHALIIL